MNLKAWVSLSASLALGLLAAGVAHFSIAERRPAAVPVKTVSVVVAKGALPPGHELVADDLALTPIAAKTPPADSFTDATLVVGRVTAAPMVGGQPVLQSFLAPKGSVGGLQAMVPPGMRAITLDINESTGVAGLLNPGCHVDVVATSLDAGNMDKSVSRVIVQDAPILAMGQRLAGPRSGGEKDNGPVRTVTLLVWPRDAEALDLGASAAHLRLALRGSGDTADADDTGVVMAELRGSILPNGSSGIGSQIPAVPTVATNPDSANTPTTQPADGTVAPVDPTRIVTVILGNDERRMVFRQDGSKPAPTPAQVSDTKQPSDSQ